MPRRKQRSGRACDWLLQSSEQDGNPQRREDHESPSGWYSFHVLSQALTTTAMERAGRVTHLMVEQPLSVDPAVIYHSEGAIVNVANWHWVALRWDGRRLWLIDSMAPRAQLLSHDSYLAYLVANPHAYAIHRAPEVGAEGRAAAIAGEAA